MRNGEKIGSISQQIEKNAKEWLRQTPKNISQQIEKNIEEWSRQTPKNPIVEYYGMQLYDDIYHLASKVEKNEITMGDADRLLDERGALYLTIMEEANQYTSSVPFHEGETPREYCEKISRISGSRIIANLIPADGLTDKQYSNIIKKVYERFPKRPYEREVDYKQRIDKAYEDCDIQKTIIDIVFESEPQIHDQLVQRIDSLEKAQGHLDQNTDAPKDGHELISELEIEMVMDAVKGLYEQNTKGKKQHTDSVTGNDTATQNVDADDDRDWVQKWVAEKREKENWLPTRIRKAKEFGKKTLNAFGFGEINPQEGDREEKERRNKELRMKMRRIGKKILQAFGYL